MIRLRLLWPGGLQFVVIVLLFVVLGTQITTSTHDICPSSCKGARIISVDAKSYTSLVNWLGIQGCDIDSRDACHPSFCADLAMECSCSNCSIRVSSIRITPLLNSPSRSTSRFINGPLEFDSLERFEIRESTLAGSVPTIYSSALKTLRITGNTLVNGSLDSLEIATSLEELDLSNNGLRGNIPNLGFERPFLKTVNLSGNNFDDINQLIFASNIEKIDLSGNKLTGPFPPQCADSLEGNQAQGRRRRLRLGRQRVLETKQCLIGGQRVPTSSPFVQVTQQPTVSTCASIPIYPNTAVTPLRTSTGFSSRIVQITSDSTDGIVFSMRYSLNQPYFEPTTTSVSSSSEEEVESSSNLPSRVQIGLVSSSTTNDTRPVLIFDVMAHSDRMVSARILARMNGTVGILSQGSAKKSQVLHHNISNEDVVSVFCSWKRNRAVDIKCGLALEAYIVEFTMADPQFEQAILSVIGFTPGTDVVDLLNGMASMSVPSSALPTSFSVVPLGFSLEANAWTPVRRQLATSSETNPRLFAMDGPRRRLSEEDEDDDNNPQVQCVGYSPFLKTNVTCDLKEYPYQFNFVDGNGKLTTGLQGCASIDEFPPAQSKEYQGREGLTWCPTKLGSDLTYFKRDRLGNANTNWVVCLECTTLQQRQSDELPQAVMTPNPTIETAHPSLAPTLLPEPFNFEYCESAFNLFAPYRCNPFNCVNGSVRCVDDLFGGDGCGEQNQLDRCDKLGVSLVACPLENYYTCNNGKCVEAFLGAEGCEDHGGVRFSPWYCVGESPSPTIQPSFSDGVTDSPHFVKETLSPFSSSPTVFGLDDNNGTFAASLSPLVPAVSTLGVLILCFGFVFVCWRRGVKARKWSKLVAATPTSRIRRFSTNPLAFSSNKLDKESALLKKTGRADVEPEEALPATAPCPLEPLQEDELANILADTLMIHQAGPPVQKRSSSLGGASKHQLKSFASTSTMATAKLSTPTLSNRELFPQGEDNNVNTPVGSSSLPAFSPFLKRQFDTEPALPSTPFDMDLASGSCGLEINFEDIELGDLLGAGGNGRIFKATYNGTPVAVKELFSVMRGSSTEFSREFEALKLLRHPHIIQLFGTCLAPSVDAKGISRHFIVTELAHESLADRLARVNDPIDQTTAERYATEIASAGAFIHAHNMIHFDIKPQNVLLDMTGTVKICDLGIAKFVQMSAQGENHVTLTSAQGTPAYMSPELLAGDDASKITKKVDVYAFGVLTWEIAHRTPPYPASWSLLTLFRKVDSGYRPEIDEDKLPFNTSLRQVVEQCWAGEPEDRPNFKDVIGLLTKKKTFLPSPIREAMRPSPRQQRQSPYHPLFGVSPEPGSRVTIRTTTGPVEEAYDGDGEEMMMIVGGEEEDRPQSRVSAGSPRKSELFRQRSGTVVGVNEDGSLAVQMDPDNHDDGVGEHGNNPINPKTTTEDEQEDVKQQQQPIVNVSTADIIQVMEPMEMNAGEDGQGGFVPVDRTIRGLALSHARRKVQEYKRAMQQQQQEKSENRRMIKRQLSMSSAKIGGDDMKLVVVRHEEDDGAFEERRPNEGLRLQLDGGADANNDDSQDGQTGGMGLGLKLDLDDDALKTDEDNKSVDLENGLLITEGVPLDANGGLTRHANRKVFKKDLDVSFDTTMVSFMNDDDDDEDDALVNFPSIAQESVVVLSELGSGACGMVYKAIHVSTLQLIAIKRVNVSDKLKRHQVVRETRIMLANNLHTTNVKSPPRLVSSVSAKDLRGSSFKDRKSLTKQHSSFSKRLLEYPSARFTRSASKQHPLRRPGLGKRFASANSPALVISPATKSDRKLLASTSRGDVLEVSSSKKKGASSVLSTEDVARGITQVKASSFACEKIVKLYDAALFAREIFADSFRVAADGSEKDFALVMEYLDGGSLEDHMKHSGPCESEATIAKVAIDCLEALHFLQINKIIHRDIKPANILLSRKGTAKLTDFGVVKELDDDSMNLGKTFVGTITYMSPERLRGHPYSFVSDVWSLGLTLLAFALGKYPVDREKSRNIFALLEFFEKDDVLRGLENRFSPELLAFFRASLHPSASERPDAKTLLSHPFLVNSMNDFNSVLHHSHPRGESMHLSFEDKTLDLQLIARKVVEKMMLDWMNQQSTSEFPREGVEFTFAEESFIRLAHQLGVTVDDVREAFTEQIDQLKDVLN